MKWRMRFNGDKSGCLLMDRRKDAKRKQASWNMTLNLQGKMKRKECGKCLGLWFDERSTFEKHALATHMKLQKKRRFLLRLCSTRSHMPFNVRLKFCNSWFTATSRHVAPTWRSKKNLKVKQLDSMESQTLKRVLGSPGSASNDTPHVSAATLPPRHRTQVQCTKTWLRTNVWVEDVLLATDMWWRKKCSIGALSDATSNPQWNTNGTMQLGRGTECPCTADSV
eukprot:jgi/Bigna1/144798/aug1.91_g19506